MGYTALEDLFGDIVGKARRGLGLSTEELARMTGLAELEQMESYAWMPDEDGIRTLARVLNLSGDKLVDVANGWMPAHPNDGFEDDVLKVERLILDAGMQVNCYVFTCGQTGAGAVVDPGGEPDRILALIAHMGVRITHILLTHGHGDHVGGLAAVARATGAAVCGCPRDFGLMGDRRDLVAVQVDEGWKAQIGKVTVDAVGLAGHTPGGIGYACGPVFFSGDALFAGSLGGARGAAYAGQVEAVRRKVLSLPEETWIFPGHGPVTSVGQERAHNPYFL